MIGSNKGFYVGDICYVLEDDIYYGVWGEHNYEQGEYQVSDDLSFEVFSTAYGDGEYYDSQGNRYPVDAGVIGIVPLELCNNCSIEDMEDCGRVFEGATDASIEGGDGYFEIKIYYPDGKKESFEIDTRDEYEEEEYDEDEDW